MLGGGFPDIVVGHVLCNVLVEIKNGKGKLNELETKFFNTWPGPKCVVWSSEEAIEKVGEIIRNIKR